MNNVVELIGSVGFPIAAFLLVYIDLRGQVKILKEEIRALREAVQSLANKL